jgi:hypothetical protein
MVVSRASEEKTPRSPVALTPQHNRRETSRVSDQKQAPISNKVNAARSKSLFQLMELSVSGDSNNDEILAAFRNSQKSAPRFHHRCLQVVVCLVHPARLVGDFSSFFKCYWSKYALSGKSPGHRCSFNTLKKYSVAVLGSEVIGLDVNG